MVVDSTVVVENVVVFTDVVVDASLYVSSEMHLKYIKVLLYNKYWFRQQSIWFDRFFSGHVCGGDSCEVKQIERVLNSLCVGVNIINKGS